MNLPEFKNRKRACMCCGLFLALTSTLSPWIYTINIWYTYKHLGVQLETGLIVTILSGSALLLLFILPEGLALFLSWVASAGCLYFIVHTLQNPADVLSSPFRLHFDIGIYSTFIGVAIALFSPLIPNQDI